MMDKIRVKDLADDLKMQPKDLLAVIKDLHIQARASNSVLADEEITRIKDRIQQNSSAERREGTDIIVRRRRKTEPEDAPAAKAEVPQKNAQPEEPARAAEPEPAPKVEPEKAVKKEAEKAAAAPKTARVVKPAAATASARVVSRPAPKAEPETPPQAKAPQSKVDDKRASQANLSAEPEKGADGSTVSSTPRFAESSQPDRQEQDNAQQSTGVRVISRPSAEQQTARPSGGDRRPAGTQPGGRQGYQRPGADGRGTDRGDRGDRTPGRFAGQAPRPAPGQAPRPAPGQAPRPAPAPLPPTDGDSDRSKKRGKGKRTVDFSEDKRFRGEGDEAWARAGAGRKNKGRKQKPELKQASQPLKAAKRKIRMEEFIRVADLAHQMGLKAGEIIKILFNLGVMATINQSLDIDTATLVASEFNYEVERVGFSEDEFIAEQDEDDPSKLSTRPPVVTIMGHVDHGKTSLLDAIRKTSVTSGEAGGITQHIGAYHVKTKKGDIVFLDTPGHEAFTAMRARGAEVTDIVVLVVAADDGVMEQTREAINHSKAAGVPIMVAVNKMDKEDANPDRVKRELADLGMVPEEWGGDVTFSYVSAKTRDGLDEFLELLALQAEILELKANPNKAARGHIVEAKLDKGRGALGTVLIQQGTLRVGDSFVSGVYNGRVRAMFDDQGHKVNEAGPSMPVEVQGFDGVPEAGEEFIVIADEKTARRIAESRALKQRERELAKESKITLETFLSRRADAAEAQVLNLVVKADVHGSLEAIQEQLKKLSGEKVRINIVHGGTGAISESDVLLAAASEAIVIGFNVRPNQKTKDLAEQEKVDIRFYDIIYKLTEEITSAMEGMLSPVEKEVSIGSAEVRETFSVPKVGVIAGCMVADGKITRNAKVRLLRDGVVIHTGSISSLKRFKDDAKEVLKGYECGIGIENYNDIKVGDVIEGFEIVQEAAKL